MVYDEVVLVTYKGCTYNFSDMHLHNERKRPSIVLQGFPFDSLGSIRRSKARVVLCSKMREERVYTTGRDHCPKNALRSTFIQTQ